MRYWRSVPARRRISSAVFEISSGSRNSSTNLTLTPLRAERGRISLDTLQTVTLNFLNRALYLSEEPKRVHLVGGILLADLAHGEAHVNEHPVAGDRLVILQQAQIDLASHANYVHERGSLVLVRDLDAL